MGRAGVCCAALIAAAFCAQPAAGAVAAGPAAGTPPLLSLGASPRAFSPNGDGRLDTLRLDVAVDRPSRISIRLLDRAGAVVAIPAELAEPSRGATIRWDGRVGAATLRDGSYTVVATAVDEAGETATATAPLLVDTEPARLSWHESGGLTSGRLRAALSVRDASTAVDASFTLVNAYGREVLRWHRRLSADGSRVRLERALDGTLPGVHHLEARLQDAAGNVLTSRAAPYAVSRPVANATVARVDGVAGRVALTFDDCNSASAWDAILDVLARHRATAAFFCPALQVRPKAAQARRTLASGHTIGAHGFDHRDLELLPREDVLWRLRGDRDVWWAWRASANPYFRPPYGAFDSLVTAAAGEAGYRWTVLWDVDSEDWRTSDPNRIVSRTVAAARSGSIVLLHVTPQTAAALPDLIARLRRRGLEPTGLDQLLHARGARPSRGGWPDVRRR